MGNAGKTVLAFLIGRPLVARHAIQVGAIEHPVDAAVAIDAGVHVVDVAGGAMHARQRLEQLQVLGTSLLRGRLQSREQVAVDLRGGGARQLQ